MKRIIIHQNWQFWKDGNEADKRTVHLPHDAMQLEERIPGMENGGGSGYYPGGKYWYAKRFFGKEEFSEQAVIVEFEGVYMNATVYLNGERVGGWVYGYTNFFVDLTGKINIGEENELLVEVDNSLTPNSRWYTGSGIYRPVQLWTGGVAHIPPQGMRIQTVSINPAVIQLHADVEGAGEHAGIGVAYTVYDGERIVAAAEGKIAEVEIPNAKLWSAETPHLYTVKAALTINGILTDEATERFGIRVLGWSAEKGLRINGETVKLRGGCVHHDNGILGACTYDKAEKRKIVKLKEFGFNAIRYSHYPAGKNLLDICDELGMYVLDESFDQWRIPNTKYDYSTVFDAEWERDLAALAAKDYNHPSVIMYCIGNEVGDVGRSYGAALAGKLYAFLKSKDSTRPVTIATNVYLGLMASLMEEKELESGKAVGSIEVNELMSNIEAFKAALTKEKVERLVGDSFDAVDVAGYNYGRDLYDNARTLKPDRVILSSETLPAKLADNWRVAQANSWCIGDFHWTAWDYLGEAGVGLPVYGCEEAPFSKPYPCLTAACGSFDLIGCPEAAAYYAAILWGAYKKPYIGVRPVCHSGEQYTLGGWRLTDAVDCWTWEGCEGKTAEIIIYAAGHEAALFQGGKLIARKPLENCKAEFETVYCPGTLEAVCYDANGAEIGRTTLATNGRDIRLELSPEETEIIANADDILFVSIRVTDEFGAIRMTTEKRITVAVEGEGVLLALGSGRPETEERFSDTTYTSWHGSLLAAIRATGKPGIITITASCEGCENVSAQVRAIPFKEESV